MLKMSTVEARENFSDMINKAAYGNEHVVLTRRGRPLVAVIPLEDLEQLRKTAQYLSSTVTQPHSDSDAG